MTTVTSRSSLICVALTFSACGASTARLADLQSPYVTLSVSADGTTASVYVAGLPDPGMGGSCPTFEPKVSLAGKPMVVSAPGQHSTTSNPHGLGASSYCTGPTFTGPIDPTALPVSIVVEDESAKWTLTANHLGYTRELLLLETSPQKIRLQLQSTPGFINVAPASARVNPPDVNDLSGGCAPLLEVALDGDEIVLTPDPPIACAEPLTLTVDWPSDLSGSPISGMAGCPSGGICAVSPQSFEATVVNLGRVTPHP